MTLFSSGWAHRSLSLATAFAFLSLSGCGGHQARTSSSGSLAAGNTRALGAELPTDSQVDSLPDAISGYGASGTSLPKAVDLSTRGDLPPPGDQGALGSCVAWAAGYGMQTYMGAIQFGGQVDIASHQGSAADLYSKLLTTLRLPCGSGTNLDTAMQIMVTQGITNQDEVPYSEGCSATETNGPKVRIGGYHAIKPSDATGIKRQLAAGRVLPFAFVAYDSLSPWGEGPKRYGVYGGGGKSIGGHAMLLVGYDDTKKAWKAMNSWGSNWGNGGFLWMSYAHFKKVAKVVYVADGGVALYNGSTNSIQTDFENVSATQYSDAQSGKPYLVLNYSITEPVWVERETVAYPDGHVYASSTKTAAWQMVSYSWLSSDTLAAFPPGQYIFSLEGKTQDGRSVALSRTVTLTQRSRGGQKLRAITGDEDEELPEVLIDSPRYPMQPGTPLIMDGHPVVLMAE